MNIANNDAKTVLLWEGSPSGLMSGEVARFRVDAEPRNTATPVKVKVQVVARGITYGEQFEAELGSQIELLLEPNESIETLSFTAEIEGLPTSEELIVTRVDGALNVVEGSQWILAENSSTTSFECNTEFDVGRDYDSVFIGLTAKGIYQAFLNGHEIDEFVLKPGWGPYDEAAAIEVTDVTNWVVPGKNTLRVVVAGGWFTESYGFSGHGKRAYRGNIGVLGAVLGVAGTATEVLAQSGEGWWGEVGLLVRNSLYHGSDYEFTASHRRKISLKSCSVTETIALRSAEPIREGLRFEGTVVRRNGNHFVEFPQNVSGRLAVDIETNAECVIAIRYAEVLQDGELARSPLRAARSTDSYRVPPGRWQLDAPFSQHGFQFAEVTSSSSTTVLHSAFAVSISSMWQQSSAWSFEDSRLNRLVDNALWSLRDNFLAVPSDCPQRDERLGWTGDIQVFAISSCKLTNPQRFLNDWMASLRIEQRKLGGSVPAVVPNVLGFYEEPIAAWGDAVVAVPYALWRERCDIQGLRKNIDAIEAWLDCVLSRIDATTGLWKGEFQFGDWLDPRAPTENPGLALTNSDYVANMELLRSLRRASEISGVLGIFEQQKRWSREWNSLKDAIQKQFVAPSGLIVSDTITAYALAIEYELVTPTDRLFATVAGRLNDLVKAAGYRVMAGFVGAPVLLSALKRAGFGRTAAAVLMQDHSPSWLAGVRLGATTTWERWDSLKEDGTLNPGGMTSFNHYAFGSVVEFLFEGVAGIEPRNAGYRTVFFDPLIDLRIGSFTLEQSTVAGDFRVTVSLTANAEAQVELLFPPAVEVVTPLGEPSMRLEGKSTWNIDVRDSEEVVTNLSLSSSLDQVSCSPDAVAAVYDTLRARDPRKHAEILDQLIWSGNRSLGSALQPIDDVLLAEVESALTRLNVRVSQMLI